MKTIRMTIATFLCVVSYVFALPSIEPIPKPAQPVEKAIELARKEIRRTDASDYLLMMAVYARPTDFAMRLNEWEKKVVQKLQPNEYSWFIEMRHPVNNDQSTTLIVKRDDKVKVLWETE